MANARLDQMLREAFITQDSNALICQFVREAWVPVEFLIQVMGGAFQDALSRPIAGGTMTVRLPEDARAPLGQMMSNVVAKTTTDSSGNIVPIFLWNSAALIAGSGRDSFYILTLYTAGGQACWKTYLTLPVSPNPYNLVNATPLPV